MWCTIQIIQNCARRSEYWDEIDKSDEAEEGRPHVAASSVYQFPIAKCQNVDLRQPVTTNSGHFITAL